MLNLIQQIKNAENEIRVINNREEQLNLKTTVFSELLKIKNESKIMTNLWEAIIQFNDLYDDWKNMPLHLIVID